MQKFAVKYQERRRGLIFVHFVFSIAALRTLGILFGSSFWPPLGRRAIGILASGSFFCTLLARRAIDIIAFGSPIGALWPVVHCV